jgi:hypothetical protein
MTSEQVSIIAQSTIASAVLLWMLLSCLPALRLDIFRQKMFVVRDELFDYAAAGNIDFNHPAYRLLRKSMNGFLRYGHRLSLFQLIITWFRWHFADEKPVSLWSKQWKEALSSIENEDVKTRLMQFQSDSMNLVIGRIVTGSPVILAVLVVLGIGVCCQGAWNSTAALYRAAAETTLRAFAIDPSALEDEALRAVAHS